MSSKVLESLRTLKVYNCNLDWHPVSRKSYVFLELDKQKEIPYQHFIRLFRFSMLNVRLRKWLSFRLLARDYSQLKTMTSTDDEFAINSKVLHIFSSILFIYLNIRLKIRWIYPDYLFYCLYCLEKV